MVVFTWTYTSSMYAIIVSNTDAKREQSIKLQLVRFDVQRLLGRGCYNDGGMLVEKEVGAKG